MSQVSLNLVVDQAPALEALKHIKTAAEEAAVAIRKLSEAWAELQVATQDLAVEISRNMDDDLRAASDHLPRGGSQKN